MPSVRDALGSVLEIPGVRAALVVGRDGLLIEATGRGDERFLDMLGAMGASALGTTEALGAELGQGRTVGAILEFENALVSVDPLGEFAAIVTLAENAASLGRIRQVVRSSREELLHILDAR